jgi:hypothetical protein
MRHFAITVTAALALAACADTGATDVQARSGKVPELSEPSFYVSQPGTRWTLYTNQTPESTLDGAEPGWEVGTRFYSSVPGRIVAFRFWRAVGETGTNTIKLWTDSGRLLRSKSISGTTSGWRPALLKTPFSDESVCIQANTWYRVSANTNSKQVKTGGGYSFYGPLGTGPLYSNGSNYGQPINVMPTTGSNSYFFVDVTFEDDPTC